MTKQLLTFLSIVALTAMCAKPEKPNAGNEPNEPDKVEVTGVSLSGATFTMEIGESQTLTATISPDNATDKTITWSSSDATVATVDQNGTVTAVSHGTSTIKATAANGINASITITVNPRPVEVTGVSISKASSTMQRGASQTLTAIITPDNANDKTITWSSSDTAVATVDQNGTVTAVTLGKSTITATAANGINASITITVTPKAGETKTINDIECVYIPAGTFIMGSPTTEEGRGSDEDQYEVTLSKGFYMSKYEITNSQFARFLNLKNVGQNGQLDGKNIVLEDSNSVEYNTTTNKWEAASGYENYPIIYVLWYGVNEYAKWIGGALPTEAQWEYACRAGTTTAWYCGDAESQLDRYAWYNGNSNSDIHEVGAKEPNAWGLYDMHGNVSEWCSGFYGDYPDSAQTDPNILEESVYHVLRGGSWYEDAKASRSARRYKVHKNNHSKSWGFRVVFAEQP